VPGLKALCNIEPGWEAARTAVVLVDATIGSSAAVQWAVRSKKHVMKSVCVTPLHPPRPQKRNYSEDMHDTAYQPKRCRILYVVTIGALDRVYICHDFIILPGAALAAAGGRCSHRPRRLLLAAQAGGLPQCAPPQAAVPGRHDTGCRLCAELTTRLTICRMRVPRASMDTGAAAALMPLSWMWGLTT